MEPAQAEDRWFELWGTFSVRDHCRRGAFMAEVLLYDHLLIPCVPTQEDFEKGALARDEKVDPATQAQREWKRWSDAGWQPQRQADLLPKLGDRATLIPWTMERESEWKTMMAAEFRDARRNGFFMTGSVLQQFAPAMAKTVVAVSQYDSVDELKAKKGIRQLHPHEKVHGSALLAALGHELLLPGDPNEDNFRHLEEAVEIGSDPVFRERRRALFEWQQQFVKDGLTDAPSIKRAIDHMEALVNDLRTINEKQKHWGWAKRVFNFLGMSAKVATLAGPAGLAYSAAGGAMASVGLWAVDEVAPKPTVEVGMAAATLVLDVQTKFGIS